MSQSNIYTVFCVVVGDYIPFPIEIEKSKTVGWLKRLIKQERSKLFADIDPASLNLYHVEIADDRQLVAKVKAYPLDDSNLRPTRLLTSIFPAPPKLDTVHFIVNLNVPVLSNEAKLELQQSTSPEFNSYVDAVKVFTTAPGIYTLEDLGDDSNNTHIHIASDVASSPLQTGQSYLEDDLVSAYLQKLNAKRVASQAQLQVLKGIFDQETWEDHFEASEDKVMSSIEFDTYTAHLRSHILPLDVIRHKSSAFKDAHVTCFLVDSALTERGGDTWCYDKDVEWNPLLLQGTFADRESLYRFKPHSDFCCFYATYGPLITGEIISEPSQSDRWRMLFEGIGVCRYQNMLQKSRKSIVLCLYLNEKYEMEHYLVYQAAEGDTRDVHVLHYLTLNLAKLRDTFLLSKQLFNFRDHLIQIPDIDEKRKKELLNVQKEARARYTTSVTAAKQAKSKADRSSRAPARMLGPISEDTALQATFKAIHVLNHSQKDVATAVRRSDMQLVVLKRIRTSSPELHILRLLQSRSLPGSTHIIPLLGVVERPPGISVLVMPCYTPILALSQARAEDLALQLIRGVDWLHKQLICHCDIKERNLVFDENQNRLFIIDFGLAIKLTSREQTVRGARGTAEHVAPEVGIESSWETGLQEVFLDEDSIYNPILADVWAVGDVINCFLQQLQSSTESIQAAVQKVAKELRMVDPTKRLSLHDAESRIAAACSTAATAQCPLDASPWNQGTHSSVSTGVVLQA